MQTLWLDGVLSLVARSLSEEKADLPKNSLVNADKKYASNVDGNFTGVLVHATNKLTNNLKNGSEVKRFNCAQCVRHILRKVRVAIT